MSLTRSNVTVYSAGNGASTARAVQMPGVFTAPIRPDLVRSVHKNMAKNRRQPYSVSRLAGHQTSAVSWGTGRAVARIPRVSGGGTSRSGQGAFGNFCRGGRMFAPTKIWRRWHVRTNLRTKRNAVASALAASAVPSLVMARGHRVSEISELPLVISADVAHLSRTKEAVEVLRALKAYSDVEKVAKSKKLRAGKGKMRNRRHITRRGPLIIYKERTTLVQAFRNLPGVELCSVQRLNLLQLAPGGHMGRFIIWTEDAFAALDSIFGSHVSAPAATETTAVKPAVYSRPMISIADLHRIINSPEIQKALRPAGPRQTKRPYSQKKNPLRNKTVMLRLNPYAEAMKKDAQNRQKLAKVSKAAKILKDAKKDRAHPNFVAQLLAP